jgi:hypothetical protein
MIRFRERSLCYLDGKRFEGPEEGEVCEVFDDIIVSIMHSRDSGIMTRQLMLLIAQRLDEASAMTPFLKRKYGAMLAESAGRIANAARKASQSMPNAEKE